MTVTIYISPDLAFQLHRPPTHTRGRIITQHSTARPQKTFTRPRHIHESYHRLHKVHNNTFVRPGGTKTWKRVRE